MSTTALASDYGVESTAYLAGIGATVGAAYNAGVTGDWRPLVAAVVVTGLFVVLFDGE